MEVALAMEVVVLWKGQNNYMPMETIIMENFQVGDGGISVVKKKIVESSSM